MTATITVGTRFPAHATSVGRVILAHLTDDEIDARLERADLRALTARTIVSPDLLRAELARVRRQGYAIVEQELEEGLRSVAAPVRDRDGTVVAAANIPVHASRNSLESVRRDLLPHLLDTVARIERDLAVTGPVRAVSRGSGTRR
jgi:IclR family pca regulon transcriptional regulator